jgi:beta-phosphoglucomutase-like phosphatase (HAD superfamily)
MIIIPLCGKGKRVSNLGIKPLIKVHGKEIIRHVIECFSEDEEIFIITNENTPSDLKVSLSSWYKNTNVIDIQTQTDGALHTVLLGLERIDKRDEGILIVDGDAFYTVNPLNYIDKNSNGILWFKDEHEKPIFSYILKDSKNCLYDIREKEKISDMACCGSYYFKNVGSFIENAKKIIQNNDRVQGEFYISKIVSIMNSIDNFKTYEVQGEFISLGTTDQILEYTKNKMAFMFDLDGTLVSSDNIYKKVWKELLEPFNIVMEDDFYIKNIHGLSDKEVCERLNINIDEKIKIQRFNELIKDLKIIPGSVDFIKFVKENAHPVSIVTNCARCNAEQIIKYIGLEKYIDNLVVASECIEPKPSAIPYIKSADYFNLENSQCVIFEDSKTGIASALSFNPKIIVGITGTFDITNLKKMGCYIALDNFSNIKEIYKTIINFQHTKDDNRLEKLISENLGENVTIKSTLKGGYISDVYSVQCSGKELVYKRKANSDDNLIKKAEEFELFDKEFNFYENFGTIVPVCTPKFYKIIRNEDLSKDGILMENIFPANTRNLNNDIDSALLIVSEISKMHVKFWNKNLTKHFPLLEKNNGKMGSKWSELIKNNIRVFLDRWNFILKESDKSKLITISSKFDKIKECLSVNNLTLCHGDLKSPNIFFKSNGKPCFLDWQYIVEGKGVQDIIFMLIESFDIPDINIKKDLLIQYYFQKIIEQGIKYKKKDFERDVILSTCFFPMVVCIWFGTVNTDELIDKNFPFRFVSKFLNFLNSLNFDIITEL